MNDALLDAITVSATAGTHEAERNFYSVLLESKLLLAQESGDAPRPILLVDNNDQIILPLFTDLERLQKVFPDAYGYATLPAQDIFNLAIRNQIYRVNINPEIGPGGYLERDELEALANGSIPDMRDRVESKLLDPTFVPMGDPKLPPQDVLDNVTEKARSLLSREPGVEEGFIILRNGTLAVAVHFNDSINMDDKTAFSQRFVPAIEAVLGQPLDLLWLEGERYEAVASVVPPFYRRNLSD